MPSNTTAPPAKKKGRRARLIVLLLVLALVGAVAFGGWWGVGTVRASFPQTTGEIRIDALSGDVEVKRDALGEDHDEGRVADDLRQLRVVERDVEEAVLAQGDADAQVQEQAGEPAAGRDAYRHDGDEQNERADEQEFVERVDSQWPVLSCVRLPDRLPAASTSLPYLIFNVFLMPSSIRAITTQFEPS